MAATPLSAWDWLVTRPGRCPPIPACEILSSQIRTAPYPPGTFRRYLRYHGVLGNSVRHPHSLVFRLGEGLIPRYTRPEMGHVWSDANRFAKWLEVETAAAETLAETGQVPQEAAAAIRARAKIDVARTHELEARVKHDVIAFTMAVGESIGDAAAA